MRFGYWYGDPLLEDLPELATLPAADRWFLDYGDRQQRQALGAICEGDPPEEIWLPSWDRLGDNLGEIYHYQQHWQSLGIRLICGEAQTPPQIARQVQRRQLQQGHAANRVRGLPPPGRAPFGYRRGPDRYLLDRTTAPIVKELCDHFLLFASLRGAAAQVGKKYHRRIAVATARRWLTHPVYRGDLIYHNGDRLRGRHTPILSAEEAAQIDRLLRRNRPLPRRSASAPHALAGLVRCGACPALYRCTQVQRGKYRYLQPLHCAQTPRCASLPYDQVLGEVIAAILRDFLPLAQGEPPRPRGDWTQAIAAKEALLAQLPQLQAEGILDVQTAQLRAYHLATEIAQLRQQLAPLPPANLQPIAQTLGLERFWWDLSEVERRFYFRELIQSIALWPGGSLRVHFHVQQLPPPSSG